MLPLDLGTIIIALGVIILWLSALISISKFQYGSAVGKTLWVLIVMLFPVLGALVWWGMGRKTLMERP